MPITPIANAALIVVVVVAIAATHQLIASIIDSRRHPPPGKMIDIGGYQLHLWSQGIGVPVVVCDSGAGGFALDWHLVQQAVAQFTQIVVYDRAGYGWSDAGPLPRDAEQCVKELHALLGAAKIPPPYILVGHSVGGLHVQLYASRYPADIAGIVLVDTADAMPLDEQLEYLPPKERILGRRRFLKYLKTTSPGLVYWLSRTIVPPLGVFRLMGSWFAQFIPPYSVLPAQEQAVYRARLFQTSHLRTLMDEGAMVDRSWSQVRAGGQRFGDIPLTIIKGAVEGGRQYTQPHFEPIQMFQKMRQAIQTELARRSTCGKLVVAEHSAHYVHVDQPDIVIEAIREMVGAA